MATVRFECEYHKTGTPQSYVKHIPRNKVLPRSLYQAVHVGFEHNDAGYHNKRSGGVSYLLAYTKSGQASLVYGGQRRILMPGSLVFINLAEDSLIEAPYTPWEIYFIHAYGSETDHIYRSFVQTQGNYIHTFDPTVFVSCIQQVYDHAVGDGDPYAISGQIYLLLMDVLRQSQNAKATTLVNRAMTYLNNNFDGEVSIETLATDLFVSKSFLIRRFHAELGITPKQYLTQIRLQVAKGLLVHTDKSIAEIAQETGFGTEKNVFYAFRSVLGVTPTDYRDNIYIHHRRQASAPQVPRSAPPEKA